MNNDSVAKEQNIPTEQVVVFKLDGEEYAVPIAEVREVVRVPEITPVPQSPDYILGIMNLRGKIVPVLDIEKRFHLTRDTAGTFEHIVVTEGDSGSLFGVRVDKVLEVLKIPFDTIRQTPKMVTSKISEEYLKGVAVLSEGDKHEQKTKPEEDVMHQATTDTRLLLLLDLGKILSSDEISAVQPKGASVSQTP